MQEDNSNSYLASSAMRATADTIELAGKVMGFSIVELWTSYDHLHCLYVYADKKVVEAYPDMITGHYPTHKKEHLLSPKLIKMMDKCKDDEKYIWRDEAQSISDARSCLLTLPLRSEMVYRLRSEKSGGITIYLVGLSTEPVECTDAKIKFLSGLAYSVYIAAYFIDEEEQGLADDEIRELDSKLFSPKSLASLANLNAYDTANAGLDDGLIQYAGENVGLRLTDSRDSLSPRSSFSNAELASQQHQHQAMAVRSRKVSFDSKEGDDFYPSAGSSPPKAIHSAINASGGGRLQHHTNLAHSPAEGHKLDTVDEQHPMSMSSEDKRSEWTVLPPAVAPIKMPSGSACVSGAKSGEKSEDLLDKGVSGPRIVGIADTTAAAFALSSIAGGAGAAAGDDQDILTVPRKFSVGEESVASNVSRKSSGTHFVLTSGNVVYIPPDEMPPTWDPPSSFCYPVVKIPPKYRIPIHLTTEDFTDLRHLADGSNANVYKAKFHGEVVIIKMIKKDAQQSQVAMHEFEVEHGLLQRMDHPNIIKVLGAGRYPRRFIVLEYLGGDTLSSMLDVGGKKQSFGNRLFRKPTFTYPSLLHKARDMADAFDYLHNRCHDGATLIHRDLKPDNVGFTSDGCLKLFDFGLCTCVKQRTRSDETYKMSGYTGSLRYMAPEVALRKPYSEKADVYSFGILVWQMARDRIPFKEMGKQDFMTQVVHNAVRPKLDRHWPKPFSELLKRCWDAQPEKRPSFTTVVQELSALIYEIEVDKAGTPQKRSLIRAHTESVANMAHGTWF